MGSKADQTAGQNDRFSDARFQGFKGDGDRNKAPYGVDVIVTAEDPAGTYDSVIVPPQNAVFCTISFHVTEVFDGVPTVIVGRAGATNVLVTLGDAVDLTTLGWKYVTREVIWGASAAMRVTIGGAPTQGSVDVSAQFEF